MARHEWVGKVIHKELCKKFQFNHTKGISTTQNPFWKIRNLKFFVIQTDSLISARLSVIGGARRK